MDIDPTTYLDEDFVVVCTMNPEFRPLTGDALELVRNLQTGEMYVLNRRTGGLAMFKPKRQSWWSAIRRQLCRLWVIWWYIKDLWRKL